MLVALETEPSACVPSASAAPRSLARGGVAARPAPGWAGTSAYGCAPRYPALKCVSDSGLVPGIVVKDTGVGGGDWTCAGRPIQTAGPPTPSTDVLPPAHRVDFLSPASRSQSKPAALFSFFPKPRSSALPFLHCSFSPEGPTSTFLLLDVVLKWHVVPSHLPRQLLFWDRSVGDGRSVFFSLNIS